MSKNLDFIQLNNFAKLHDAQSIWFCKTDYIFRDFEAISKLENDVVLITGNSDYAIDDRLVDFAPDNVVTWFCQNALSNKPFIRPIPIGIENKDECIRNGHGVGWGDRVQEKMDRLNRIEHESIDKFIYANFAVNTNPQHRSLVKNGAVNCEHIDWQEPNLSCDNWVSTVKKYQMVLCPAGNGVDTHRLWETLYCGRVPVTIKVGNYKIYEMYARLPIIVLDSLDELRDKNHMSNLYSIVRNKTYQLSMAYQNYWTRLIQKEVKCLKY